MPGSALTNKFMLGTATVMIGAQADLFDLTPALNSIGLVKNFTITANPAYTELTQGVKNTVVFSTLTANPSQATMEVYEYTAKNLGYALGLEGALTTTALSVETQTVGAGSPIDTSIVVASNTGILAGDFIMAILDTDDHIHVRKVASVATGGVINVDHAFNEVLPDATIIRKVNMVSGGSKTDQPFYSAKVVGKLADGEPVVLLLPKIRIVKGFNMAFKSDAYGNLPFDFTMYDQVAADTFYTDFGGDTFRIFKQK